MKLNNIHKDNRGFIKTLTGKEIKPYEEITIFETKKGYARGGCIHNKSSEHICVLKGEIDFFYTETETQLTMNAGESFTIPCKTPHYFIALEDSVVLEWGPRVEEKNEKYQPFRDKVDSINETKDK